MRIKFTGFVEIPEHCRHDSVLEEFWILSMIGDAINFLKRRKDKIERLSLTWEETKVPDKGIE